MFINVIFHVMVMENLHDSDNLLSVTIIMDYEISLNEEGIII